MAGFKVPLSGRFWVPLGSEEGTFKFNKMGLSEKRKNIEEEKNKLNLNLDYDIIPRFFITQVVLIFE